MKKIISDRFHIIDRKGNIITLKGKSNPKKYTVKVSPEHSSRYASGRFVMAKIFPWEDHYRFAGITKIKIYDNSRNLPTGIITQDMIEEIQEHFEKRLVRDAESIIVSQRSTLQGMLKKLPYVWIDGICSSIHLRKKCKKEDKVKGIVSILLNPQHLNVLVNTLPEDARKALLFVKEKGGIIRYNDLVKKYPDDTGIDWQNKLPNSPVGILRRHGLLIVGKSLKNTRFYKVVLIPKEILQIGL